LSEKEKEKESMVYGEKQREAVYEMLMDFAHRESYVMEYRYNPCSEKSEFKFMELCRLGNDFTMTIVWPEIQDSLIELVDSITVNVRRHFGRNKVGEGLKGRAFNYADTDSINVESLYPKIMIDYTQFAKYCENDIKTTQLMCEIFERRRNMYRIPKIEKVIFNAPATIVFWADNTKTVVKAENEAFDPEKGLAMAISKKALGNKGNYFNTFTKWLKKYEEEQVKKEQDEKNDSKPGSTFEEALKSLKDLGKRLHHSTNPVQKAYDILVNLRDTDGQRVDIDELIGYLGEALED
jgi:hypothetical protein